jgi:lysyl-tRNA synthetase class 2
MLPEEKIIQDKINKLDNLKTLGINPYTYTYNQTHHAKELLEKYSKLKNEEKTNDKVSVAGRILLIRRMGKVSFTNIQDKTGRIQLYIKEDDIGSKPYEVFKNLDIGDIIGITGTMFRTKMGEITIHVTHLEVLTKSLLPLPEKFHGLKDPEAKYRQRYIDLIMNEESKGIFKKRTEIIKKLRQYLDNQGFMEVETPLLQPLYGGAEARPFKTFLHARKINLYLSISPELYLKRLIVGDLERVYTICKNFRNEDIDRWHNPEFTMMECYQAYADYNDMMKLTENLVSYIAEEILGTTIVEYQGTKINLTPPWQRITMEESIKKYLHIDINKTSDKELKEILEDLKAKEIPEERGALIAAIFDEGVQPKLIQPTFITDYPLSVCPLTKIHRNNPKLVERFEAFINGVELANAYSELNDPAEQEKRLKKQLIDRSEDKTHELANEIDHDFINALKYGMPPLGGLGIGIDRLTILLTNAKSIRDVIFFPFMKPVNYHFLTY